MKGRWSALLVSALFVIGEVIQGDGKYLGCYVDNQNRRLLNGVRVEMKRTLTPSRCISYCAERFYPLAGLEFRVECFCGQSVEGGAVAPEADCYYKCPGDRRQICGGDVRLSVHDTGIKEVKGKYLGCYVDPSDESRLMKGASKSFNGVLTNQVCQRFCQAKGFKYAGTELGSQCFCSNDRPSYKSMADEGECNGRCEGSADEICGGPLRLSVYDVNPGEEKDPVESLYEGCFPAPSLSRVPPRSSSSLTAQLCVSFCYRRGQRFAKMRRGKECDCGDGREGGVRVADSNCERSCGGEPSQRCGGEDHVSVYSTGIPDKNVSPVLSYLGCFADGKSRLLGGPSFIDKSITQEKCAKFCFDRGYNIAGMEFGEECFCADRVSENARANEQDCQTRCHGHHTQKCGGPWKLSVFSTGIEEYQKSVENLCSTPTTFVDGEGVCSGQVIFSEDFNAKAVNERKWHHTITMPEAPDYPFVIYQQKSANIFVQEGNLVITPSIMEAGLVESGKIELRNCTGHMGSEDCSRQAASFNILPPVESAKITTRETFSFKYGKVEIRARIPRGDWLVPVLWLEPKRSSYGRYYSSGRIVVATARGNAELKCDSVEMGNKRLEAGIAVGIQEEPLKKMFSWESDENWSQRYHNYTLIWTPENISFSVDGGLEKVLLSKGQRISDLFNGTDVNSAPWASGSSMAPFDAEFYISLGLYAGGMTDFPDGCTSGATSKPWENFGIKGMANFWQSRNDWLNSWQSDWSSLKVDYVRVTAL